MAYHYLTAQSRQKLLWGVDRDTPGKQIQQFLLAVEGLRLEMHHEMRLSETWPMHYLLRLQAVELSVFCSLVQNGLLMVIVSAGGTGLKPLETVQTAVGVVQVLLSVLLTLQHFVRYSVLRQLTAWRQLMGREYLEVALQANANSNPSHPTLPPPTPSHTPCYPT